MSPPAADSVWTANPGPQEECLSRSEQEILTGGSRGGGKTETGLAWIGEPEYSNHPGYNSLVLRKNAGDLSDWLVRAKRFFGPLVEIKGTPPALHWKAGGLTRTGHFKDVRSLENYQGHEYQKILIEELTQVPSENLYMALIAANRSISYPELPAQLMANCNPGGPGHQWVKHRFVDVATNKPFFDPVSKRWRIFIPSTVEDNPQLMQNDPSYVSYLESLPEPLRSAWRYGSWEIHVGQYFPNFDAHAMASVPFMLDPVQHKHLLFGSLDYGAGMDGVSSFGLWLGLPKPIRLMTWQRTGMVASVQGNDLRDTLLAFKETSGMIPSRIVYDGAMDSKIGLDERGAMAPIDYFKTAFQDYGVKWIPANKARVNGWQVVLDFFAEGPDGLPKMEFWPQYNATWAECWPGLIVDPNNPSDVLKCKIDHPADETRYGLVDFRARMAREEASNTGENYAAVMAEMFAGQAYSDTGAY